MSFHIGIPLLLRKLKIPHQQGTTISNLSPTFFLGRILVRQKKVVDNINLTLDYQFQTLHLGHYHSVTIQLIKI